MAEEKKTVEEKKSSPAEKRSSDRKNDNGGGKGAVAAGIAALLLLLGGGGFFGFGPGHDMLPGNGDSVQQEQSAGEAQEEQAQETAAVQEEAENKEDSEIPDVIVVRIVKDKVTINGHEVSNKEELKKYVEEYNSDKRTFTLEEEESILGTYNWVKEVFDELDIQLKNSK